MSSQGGLYMSWLGFLRMRSYTGVDSRFTRRDLVHCVYSSKNKIAVELICKISISKDILFINRNLVDLLSNENFQKGLWKTFYLYMQDI